MSKIFLRGLLGLVFSFSSISHGMDYIPKVLKSPSFWGTVATASAIAGVIYGIEYWQDAPNRQLVQGVLEGDVEAVDEALYDGADIARRASDGKTLLHYAVLKGHYDVASLLAHRDMSMLVDREDADGNTPLYYAVKKGDLKMFKILRRAGANRYCAGVMTAELERAIDALDFLKL